MTAEVGNVEIPAEQAALDLSRVGSSFVNAAELFQEIINGLYGC
jgi:hypothetical protein